MKPPIADNIRIDIQGFSTHPQNQLPQHDDSSVH